MKPEFWKRVREAAGRIGRGFALLGSALFFLTASDVVRDEKDPRLLLLPLISLAVCLGSSTQLVVVRRICAFPALVLYTIILMAVALRNVMTTPVLVIPPSLEAPLKVYFFCGVAIWLCMKGRGEVLFAPSPPHWL